MIAILKWFLKVIPLHNEKILFFLAHIPGLNRGKRLSEFRAYLTQKGMREFSQSYPNDKKKEKKVIVYGLRTFFESNLAVFEKVFSDSFRYHGANVVNLVCGNFLPSCDGARDEELLRELCTKCKIDRPYFEKYYPNNWGYFKEYLTQDDKKYIEEKVKSLADTELEDFHYLGINTGKHAEDSVRSYFQYVYDRNNPEHVQKMRDSLRNAMMCVKVAQNLIERENPTHLFTLHGVYASWGPFCDYFCKMGLNVYVYMKTLDPDFGHFSFNRLPEQNTEIPAAQVWEEKKEIPLNLDQERNLQSFFQKRKDSHYYSLFYSEKEEELEKEVWDAINSNKKTKFVLFLHSLWDRGFETQDSKCFYSHNEWVSETIEFFKGKKDCLLFVKPHPSEYSYFEKQEKGAGDIIRDLFKELPENVFILSNKAKITSFDLMEKNCIALTFYGTVGLEFAYFKKPALYASSIFYTKANAGIEPTSKEQYFGLLRNPEPLYTFVEENHETIKRFAYHYLFRRNLRVPFYLQDKVWLGNCIDWSLLADYPGLIKNDPIIKHISQSILEGKDVVNQD